MSFMYMYNIIKCLLKSQGENDLTFNYCDAPRGLERSRAGKWGGRVVLPNFSIFNFHVSHSIENDSLK